MQVFGREITRFRHRCRSRRRRSRHRPRSRSTYRRSSQIWPVRHGVVPVTQVLVVRSQVSAPLQKSASAQSLSSRQTTQTSSVSSQSSPGWHGVVPATQVLVARSHFRHRCRSRHRRSRYRPRSRRKHRPSRRRVLPAGTVGTGHAGIGREIARFGTVAEIGIGAVAIE